MTSDWPWVGMGTALVGAASLHLALAVALSGGGEAAPSKSMSTVADRTRVTVELRPALAPQPEIPLPSAEVPPPVQDAVRSPSDDTHAMPAAPHGSPTEAPADESRHFFSIEEVDAPAVPQPDWQVDVGMLLGMGVRSFTVEVLIDETGIAKHCSVSRMEPDQTLELQQRVAMTLCETTLRPAIRRGVAVPSVRHIELLLASP